MSRVAWGIVIVLTLNSLCGTGYASATFGKVHELRQPDGQFVSVRIWGDEFYQIVESLDGYTLVRDPATLTICYAQVSEDGTELISTGIPLDAPQKSTLALKPYLRISTPAAQNIVATARAEQETRLAKGGTDKAQPQAKTFSSGKVRGLTILIDFPDAKGTIPPSEIERMCNTPGYNGYGNNGSVRDYYLDVSEGKLTYTNFVTPAYYTVQNSKAYYDNPNNCGNGQASRVQEMILEALNGLDRQGFDFGGFDSNGDGAIDALNVLYVGETTVGWGCGLWPHTGSIDFVADGVLTNRYHLSGIGDEPFMGTFCHETGHVLLGWPDLYDYDFDSYGVGKFCLMGLGDSPKNPVEPCAYLKHITGWSMTELLLWPGNYSLTAGSNHIYMIPHPSYMGEYFLLENRIEQGRDSNLPDSGLTVWHIDRITGNQNYQQHTEANHYQVSLLQADGRFDLESRRNTGDGTDLFGAPEYTVWDSATQPNSHWWDDHGSGAKVFNIGPPGPTISFSFETEPYTTPVNINTPENFPDAKFRRVVEEFMEVVPGGFFTQERAAAVSRIKKILDCPGLAIGSLQGIAFLSGLTSLNCSNNQLSSLDLSGNPELVWLSCYDNQLQNLNVTDCNKLSILDCRNNKLKVLDISNSSQLQSLSCQNNQIQSLQLRGKILLKAVTCNVNQLTTLDVSNCPILERLNCSKNRITRLDLLGNTGLSELVCTDNSIQTLNFAECSSLRILNCASNIINNLNASSCHLLEEINCIINRLTELIPPISSSLVRVHCTSNKLTSLDLSGCDNLADLDCSYNQLHSLNLDGCGQLERLSCQKNTLPTLNIPSRATIALLDCSNNAISNLAITESPKLESLYCQNNQLTDLDIHGCIALKELNCADNAIPKLDITDSPNLLFFSCKNNQISSLDFSNLTKIENISCAGNHLEEINLANQSTLILLECKENPLRRVNLSYCESLAKLSLADMPLESVNISHCLNLKSFVCYNTPLQEINMNSLAALEALNLPNNLFEFLDISQFKSLKSLDCSNNAIKQLVVNNPLLTVLDCSNNSIGELDLSSTSTLTQLDCSNNIIQTLSIYSYHGMDYFNCSKNQINRLNARINLISNFNCSNNHLSELDLNNINMLMKLDCSYNEIETLDIQTRSELQYLDCSHNSLRKISYSSNYGLTTLFCSNNLFQDVADIPMRTNVNIADIRNNKFDRNDARDISILVARIGEARFYSNGAQSGGLRYSPQTGIDPYALDKIDPNANVDIPDANLRVELEKSLKIAPGTPITYAMAQKAPNALDCSNKNIRDLTGLSYFRSIQDLNCSGNTIEIIDVDFLQKLKRLDCSRNSIEILDVAKTLNLANLNCSNNAIRALHVSGLSYLADLNCSVNSIEVLNVTHCMSLKAIYCRRNKLKTFSTDSTIRIQTIDCSYNQLPEITISNGAWITKLNASYNQLKNIDNNTYSYFFAFLNARNNYIAGAKTLMNYEGLTTLDLRDNLLDCGDWEDVKAIQHRLGEPRYDAYGNLSSGFLYSPQPDLDPYDCDTNPVPTPTSTPVTAIENWTVR